MKKELHGIDSEALRCMERYHWPGNVRELENVIERAVILAQGRLLTAELLPVCNRKQPSVLPEAAPPVSLEELERRHILGIYRQSSGHKSKTAEILGISRKTLDRKLAEYGA